MQTGDIIFIRGKSFVSKAVKFFDKGEFSHVAIAIAPNEVLEASYTTKVRRTELTYEDYEVTPMNLNAEERALVLQFAEEFEGRRYDFLSILLLLVKWVFGVTLKRVNTPKRVICSELVAYLLIKLNKADESIVDYTPKELYEYLKDK